VKAAQATKDALEARERDLLKATELNLGKSLGKLQSSIDAMSPTDLQAEQTAVADMRGVVIEIRALAREIQAKEPEYKRLLAQYQGELKQAPVAFRPAADVFDQMALEEPLKEFQDRYKRLATGLREMAKVMERRAIELAGEEKDIAEAYRYVGAAERYLTSLNEWLGTYPTFAAGVERQRHIQELKNFIRYFRDLDSAFDRFNKKVVEGKSTAS
jgi:hypothetical protein